MKDLMCITMCVAYFLFMAVNLTKDYISMCGMKEIVAVLLFALTKSTHSLSLSLSLSLALGISIFNHNFCVHGIKIFK